MQRSTVQKTLILKTVYEMTNHPTADEVYEKVSLICPNISKGTVYRDLNLLADKGMILRVTVANAPDRYDLTTKNHAHCLCTKCGRVFDYLFTTMPELDNRLNDGFVADSYNIMVKGLCKICYNDNNESI